MAKYTGRTRFNPRPPQESGVITWIVKGVFVSLIISFCSATFLSFISLMTENTYIDYYMHYLIVAITMASIFIGSVFAAKCAGGKGLVIGSFVGLIYVFVSVALGMEFTQESITILVLGNKIMAGMAAGILGGLIGVNL